MYDSAGTRLTVWVLNPYHTGSHAAWAEGYATHSRHDVQVLGMAGQFWKWRMQGGGMELAAQALARAVRGERPDVVLASSMTNLPAFLALIRSVPGLAEAPYILYMHENQLTYPPPPGSKRDLTYGMIQHLSMLTADQVCFNSDYHLSAWFDELPRMLKHFPDYTHLETVAAVRARAAVLPVGCDLRRLDCCRPPREDERTEQAPLILWNQRWEYDKDPGRMLEALFALAEEGIAFRVALTGENFRVVPAEFQMARERLGARLVHYGYEPDPAAYARWLWKAEVVLSTAIHEFFGVSIIEALYCGCLPVLPRRLSYPELLPEELHEACLYDDFSGLVELLREAVRRAARGTDERVMRRMREAAARFDWSVQAPAYDEMVEQVVRRAKGE